MKRKSKKIAAIVLSVVMLGWWFKVIFFVGFSGLLTLTSMYSTTFSVKNVTEYSTVDVAFVKKIRGGEYFRAADNFPYIWVPTDVYSVFDGSNPFEHMLSDNRFDGRASFVRLRPGQSINFAFNAENDYFPDMNLYMLIRYDGSSSFDSYQVRDLSMIHREGFINQNFVIDNPKNNFPADDGMTQFLDENIDDVRPISYFYLQRFHFLFDVVAMLAFPFLIGWLLLWGFGRSA